MPKQRKTKVGTKTTSSRKIRKVTGKRRQRRKKSASESTIDLKEVIERNIAVIVELLVERLVSLWAKEKSEESPLVGLQRVLGGTAEQGKAEASEFNAFAEVLGIKTFAVVRGTIPGDMVSSGIAIEYLVAVPQWDRDRLSAIGTTDAFHTAIYWDSLTWPRHRVITAGLEDEDEGLRRSGGVKLYH